MDEQDKNRRLLTGVLAFLGFTGLTIAYFIVHKPFTPDLALHLGTALGRLIAVTLLVVAAGGLGRRLLPMAALDTMPLACLALQAALGLGLLGLGVLALGVLGGLRPWVGWLSLALLLFWLRRSALAWLDQWRGLDQAWRPAGRLGNFLAVCIALVLAFTLLSALSPPVRFDALTYHLVLPRLYLGAGRFYDVPQNIFWGMPQAAEMLYTWALALAGDPAAPVLGWAFGVLALAGLLGFGLQKFDAETAWVGAAALVSGFTLASALSWGYADWLVMLFGVAWLIVLEAWVSDRRPQYLILAGALAGLAIGAKYTAGILLLCGAVVLVFYSRQSARLALMNLLRYGLAAGLAAAPWLVKNLLTTGNPLYPFLFPAGAMSELRLALYQGGQPFGGWQDVFLLPLRATFIGVEGGPGYSASIGPLLFGLSLCAGLGWRLRPASAKEAIRAAALIVATGVLAWMVLGRFSSYLLQSRLYFAFFPALAFLAGAGFSGLQGLAVPQVRLGRLASFLIALVVGLNTFEVGVNTLQQQAPAAALGLKPAEQYLDDNLGWYAPATQAVRSLPAGERALLLWEPRSLYCLPRCDPDEVLDRWMRARYDTPGGAPADNSAILQAWRAAGYTHLLYYRLGADFIHQEGRMPYTEADWQALEALLGDLRLVQDFGGAYQLYSMVP
jgi:hypothetical protein